MFGEIFFNVIIAPLELVFEILFMLAYNMTKSEGIAILILSLTVSTLVLPLYMRAEKIEDEQRAKEKELSSWVRHIKDHFKGDERYMILDAYYRENNYSPLYQLKSSISLILQIPFFLAAYDLLGVKATGRFYGTAFLFFKDLSTPDGLVTLGNLSINVLPILMTLINLIATIIYTKDMSVKATIRSLILPVLFLILLYGSPSALLIYWTMNNLYSLIKTIVVKYSGMIRKRSVISAGKNRSKGLGFFGSEPRTIHFVLPVVFMSILTGLLIPLSYLSASPEEFIDITVLKNPLVYLTSSFAMALGFFVVWPCIFYYLAGKKIRYVMSVFVIGLSAFSAVDYLFYGKDTGMINTALVFDRAPSFPFEQKLINLILVLLILAACVFLYRFRKVIDIVFLGAILATLTISAINAKKVDDAYRSVTAHLDDFRENSKPKIVLSSSGTNVMVIMLDKAVSGYIPYAFHECPEFEERFDGFTYYPNTASLAQNTLWASSALFGGYDYTLENMNKRSDVSLAEKHDEALKLLPEIFSGQGYCSSLIDLPFPGWSHKGDYSAFSDIDNCYTYHAVDYYSSYSDMHLNNESRRNRNLFMYSIFRCSPLVLQETVYDSGNYFSVQEDFSSAYDVLQKYRVLENLTDMTEIDNDCSGGLILFDNETTHDTVPIRDFDPYSPREFEEGYYISDGENELYLWDQYQQGCYECLIASMRELGNYFDYLREIGVYDNTRIIIVSDHSTELLLFEDMIREDFNAEWYNCTLMVKEPGAEGFSTDNTFMTNADVPALALEGIVDDPVNPFTGNPVNSDPKNEDVYVVYYVSGKGHDEDHWNPEVNPGNLFNDESYNWFKLINGDIFNSDNWIRVDSPIITEADNEEVK